MRIHQQWGPMNDLQNQLLFVLCKLKNAFTTVLECFKTLTLTAKSESECIIRVDTRHV